MVYIRATGGRAIEEKIEPKRLLFHSENPTDKNVRIESTFRFRRKWKFCVSYELMVKSFHVVRDASGSSEMQIFTLLKLILLNK